jgi:hypothetical protein
MTFSYTDALSANLDKIRLRIGDTQENAGPRPDKRNFSNEEIVFILADEGSQINGAIAHCFEILASEWTAYALSESADKVSYNARGVAEDYFNLAQEWRDKPGGALDAERSGVLVTLEREDAYT